ncbi:carboxymuconolactone decarboxylase family protein [Streptosporangium lutulentum]
MSDHANNPTPDRRIRGLEVMRRVNGGDHIGDEPGDFLGMTVEHLFAEVWSRDVLTVRDRRLMLLGLLVAQGLDDAIEVQLDAALRTGDLTPRSSARSSSS